MKIRGKVRVLATNIAGHIGGHGKEHGSCFVIWCSGDQDLGLGPYRAWALP